MRNAPPSPPLVSVNMPVYNGEKFIGQAIESILAQTYPHFELVIVDDGSTDGTLRVIEGYADARIRVVRNPRNLGLSLTRNRGIEASRGEYIAILDSDDVALPERLAEQVAFLEANPGFGLVGSWAQPVNRTGTPAGPAWELPATPESIPSILLFHNYFVQSAVMLRKSALPAPAYRTDFPPAEDYDLWVRISRHHKTWNLPKVLVHYRQHDSNISREKASVMSQSENRILAGQLERLGIQASEAELKLHKSLIPESPQVQAREALAIHAWLNGLLRRNEAHNVYDPAQLHPLLTTIWQKYFANLLTYDRALLQILLASPFVPFGVLPPAQRITLIAKCLLQWKTRI